MQGDGKLDNISIVDMNIVEENDETNEHVYEAEINLKTGGNYGYTFRAMPKHKMLLDAENLNLVSWFEDKK